MSRSVLVGVLLMGIAFSAPAHAKKPAAADEAAVRSMIAQVYKSYTTPIPEAPEDGSYAPENAAGAAMDGYELPQTKTLAVLIDRWSTAMAENEELYNLNSYDWYCQCQDNDNNTARLMKQSYVFSGKDRIDAKIVYSPGRYEGRDHGAPLTFRFKREDGQWKLDDLRFRGGSTLRSDLASDIKDAEKDHAKSKVN
jgi:hypothetical protein